MKIALLTEIPAPFRIPLFNALAAAPDVELQVLFLSEEDPRRTHYRMYTDEFAFDWKVLEGRELVHGSRWFVLNRGVLRALRDFQPDVLVVGGWNQTTYWIAALYARRLGVPMLCWVESTVRDERRTTFPTFESARKVFARLASGFLVPGQASAKYVRSLGARRKPVAVAPNAVDHAIFGERVAQERTNRDELRRRLGLDRCAILYVGRLDPVKSLDTLMAAMRDVEADLVVIGAGELEDALRAQAPSNVRFIGALDRDELPPWYAVSDVFVLPSRSEQWGMVLNEAAAAGLPIVSTDAAGAAWELVRDGENGFRVPAGDVDALAGALRRLVADPAFREQARDRSLELAAEHTPEAWAEAVVSLGRAVRG
jgi:glycosyltransferase involved in cell wall biosynthesis